jgi:hypothetical protein
MKLQYDEPEKKGRKSAQIAQGKTLAEFVEEALIGSQIDKSRERRDDQNRPDNPGRDL